MKISDRDKKLILFVLLVAIIALPIVFFINPRNKASKELDNQLVELNERYNYLKDLYDKKAKYEEEIARLNAERDSLIKDFAGGVLTENTIMFLREIEKSDDHKVRANVIAFVEDEETTITEASVNDNGEYVDGLTAIKSTITVDYSGEYNGVVEFLNYIFTYKDKMILSSLSMELDEETNLIKGTYILDQYAISGNGKDVERTDIPSMEHGTSRLFRLTYDDEGNVKSYWRSIGVTDMDPVTNDNDEGNTQE